MSKRTLGVQNMYQIEIAYVSKKYVVSNIQKKIWLSDNANIHTYV